MCARRHLQPALHLDAWAWRSVGMPASALASDASDVACWCSACCRFVGTVNSLLCVVSPLRQEHGVKSYMHRGRRTCMTWVTAVWAAAGVSLRREGRWALGIKETWHFTTPGCTYTHSCTKTRLISLACMGCHTLGPLQQGCLRQSQLQLLSQPHSRRATCSGWTK